MRIVAGLFLIIRHYIKLYEVAWSKSRLAFLAIPFLASCANNGVEVRKEFSDALPNAFAKKVVPLQGREVQYAQGEQSAVGYFSRPNSQVGRGSVVLVHGERGLTERLKLFADDLASEGYAVLAVNLSLVEYSSNKALDKKKIKNSSISNNEKNSSKAKMKNISDAITFLTMQEKSNGKIAICGWASGGTLVLDYVLNYGGIDGTALFYSQLPKDLSTLYNLDHAIYGTFLAKGDVTPAQLAELSYSQRSAGLYSDIFAYPDVEKGFFFSENDNQNNKLAAEDAWIRLKAYFKRVLSTR